MLCIYHVQPLSLLLDWLPASYGRVTIPRTGNGVKGHGTLVKPLLGARAAFTDSQTSKQSPQLRTANQTQPHETNMEKRKVMPHTDLCTRPRCLQCRDSGTKVHSLEEKHSTLIENHLARYTTHKKGSATHDRMTMKTIWESSPSVTLPHVGHSTMTQGSLTDGEETESTPRAACLQGNYLSRVCLSWDS